MSAKEIIRRTSIPVLYARGNHYEVGFDVGRTFSGLVQSLLDTYEPLNKELVPYFNTPHGKKLYDKMLADVTQTFPQYIRELRGIAEGAQVSFHKLFILNCNAFQSLASRNEIVSLVEGHGCSTLCCTHPGKEGLGHNEDGPRSMLNHCFILDAHINPDEGDDGGEEKFTAFCYPGELPGVSMNQNHHGLIFTVNTVLTQPEAMGNIPTTFSLRAMLAAKTLEQVLDILSMGGGPASGSNINLVTLHPHTDPVFYQIEFAPPVQGTVKADIDVHRGEPGKDFYHFNRYLRLNPDCAVRDEHIGIFTSTIHRQNKLAEFSTASSIADIAQFLGDESDVEYSVFRDKGMDKGRTMATGIFDIAAMEWLIYTDNPKTTKPNLVLPIKVHN